MLLTYLTGYLLLLKKIRKTSQETACPELRQYTGRKVRVLESSAISMPFMTGVFRPMLILPKRTFTPEQLHNILRHEMTHFHRRDILYKWFAAIVKCVHWFNPVMYYVARQINTECEISCDLSATAKMNDNETRSYVDTILSMLSVRKTKAIPLTTGMAGNKKILKMRFEMMKNRRNTSRLMSVLSAVLAVCMFGTTVFASGVLSDFAADDYTVEILNNGKKIELENKPFIENGEVYLPLREIFYKLGFMDNEECYMEWNNGRIEFCIADKSENTEFVSVWAVEIGRNELIYNAFERTPSIETTQSFINAPVLKEDLTYIPYSYVEFLLNAASPKEWNISYSIYDKNGEITDISDAVYQQFTGEGFSVKIPRSWNGKYVVNTDESDYGTSYSFIQKATYDKYGAGVLCSIEKVRREAAEELLNMLGGSELLYSDENYAYIFEIPTDVQYPVWADHDEEDVAIAAEYQEMFEQVDFIKNSFNLLVRTSAYYDNAEKLSFDDMTALQSEVDNGHYPWRLDPQQTLREYAQSKNWGYGEITELAGTGVLVNAAYVSDGHIYHVELMKPVRQDETGIWVVRKFVEYTEAEN